MSRFSYSDAERVVGAAGERRRDPLAEVVHHAALPVEGRRDEGRDLRAGGTREEERGEGERGAIHGASRVAPWGRTSPEGAISRGKFGYGGAPR
jgi:hypothetical protein